MDIKISKEIEDFYTGKDLRVDHYLIRCARSTELFSHVDEVVGLQVYQQKHLLYQSLANQYRWQIQEYNYQLRENDLETVKKQKEIFKGKIYELKTYIKGAVKEEKKKLKAELCELKAMGYAGFHKKRRQAIVDKIVPLGDMVIECEDFAKQRNAEVVTFLESLPAIEIEHTCADDWKKIQTPKGYEKFFNISEKQYKSREQFLRVALAKIKSLNMAKREALESVMLECAAEREAEERYKYNQLQERMSELKNAIWSWSEGKKYPEVIKIAIKGINDIIAMNTSKEMLEHSRLKASKHLHRTYYLIISDIEKELEQLQEQQM